MDVVEWVVCQGTRVFWGFHQHGLTCSGLHVSGVAPMRHDWGRLAFGGVCVGCLVGVYRVGGLAMSRCVFGLTFPCPAFAWEFIQPGGGCGSRALSGHTFI